MAVQVKRARADDPLAIQILGLKEEALVESAEDGAFAFTVDKDQRLRARRSGNRDELGLDSSGGEGSAMESRGVIVADLANIARAQAPLLAGDDRGGDLAAGQDFRIAVLDLGAG